VLCALCVRDLALQQCIHDDETWLGIWRAFIAELEARGRWQWETAFIDGTFAPAKKGPLTSVLPSAGKAQSAGYWSSVRVFLCESPLPRRPQRRSRSSMRRGKRGFCRAAATRNTCSAIAPMTVTRGGAGRMFLAFFHLAVALIALRRL
jgi:hypothetical protein